MLNINKTKIMEGLNQDNNKKDRMIIIKKNLNRKIKLNVVDFYQNNYIYNYNYLMFTKYLYKI